MAQKVNPISVRLLMNRSSDSSWFSEGDRGHRILMFKLRDITNKKTGLRVIQTYQLTNLLVGFVLMNAGKNYHSSKQPNFNKSLKLDRPFYKLKFRKGWEGK